MSARDEFENENDHGGRGGRGGRNSRKARKARKGRNFHHNRDHREYNTNQSFSKNWNNNQSHRNNHSHHGNDNNMHPKNRKGRNNQNSRNGPPHDNWKDYKNHSFNNSQPYDGHHNQTQGQDYDHRHNKSHSGYNGSRNNSQPNNGFGDHYTKLCGPGEHLWIAHDDFDHIMTEATYDFSAVRDPGSSGPRQNPSFGVMPNSPIDEKMSDAPPSHLDPKSSTSSWQKRNDEMLSLLYEKRPSGVNADLTVIRHALDNMDEDYSYFIRASLKEDAGEDELKIDLELFKLHLALWVQYFESDSAEIYALQHGFSANFLGQENLQQVPLIVGWFASDDTYAQQACHGFLLLWSKFGVQQTRKLGLTTVCDLFIKSLRRPELHVPVCPRGMCEAIYPDYAPDPSYYSGKPFKTVGSIVNAGK